MATEDLKDDTDEGEVLDEVEYMGRNDDVSDKASEADDKDLEIGEGGEKDEKDEEPEKEEELKEELEPEKEEIEPELVPVTAKKIQEKYPDFFKTFPDLRESFFVGKAFREVFPTVEDAKDAAQKAENFDFFDSLLTKGDTSGFLGALEEADPKMLKNFSTSFLPALYTKSKDTYFDVTTPLYKSLIRSI